MPRKRSVKCKELLTRHCEEVVATTDEAISTMGKHSYVYLITNNTNTVIYAGVTNNLQKRVFEHKEKLVEGFTKKYNVNKLVYYEQFDNIVSAIEREKRIKGGSRQDKINLINIGNPKFEDLYNNL